MKKFNVPFIKPEFPTKDELIEDYEQILSNNWFTNFGPFESSLRAAIADYIGNESRVVTASSATAALLLAIKAYLPPVDTGRNQVIMPSFTFAAGAEVLILLGYTPVFIDLDESTWQPSLTEASEYLKNHKEKVCGVLFCNIFGVGASDIDQWQDLCSQFEISLVVDSAAGFGSEYVDGSKVGTKGDCEVFSLHATKPFAVGEGGAVLCRSNDKANLMMKLSNFGFNKAGEAMQIGINAKLAEIPAAIGLRQLKLLDSRLKKRRRILQMYKSTLEPMGFIFQKNDDLSSVPFASCLVPDIINRHELLVSIRDNGIEGRNYYSPPLHRHAAIEQYSIQQDLPVTNKICDRIISLPVHTGVDKNTIAQLGEVVREYVGK